MEAQSSTTLIPSSGHNCFVVTTASLIVTYTGQTSVSSGQTLTLSSTLTTSSGTPIVGQTVVETLGTGYSAQNCTAAVTNSLGVALAHHPGQPGLRLGADVRLLRR